MVRDLGTGSGEKEGLGFGLGEARSCEEARASDDRWARAGAEVRSYGKEERSCGSCGGGRLGLAGEGRRASEGALVVAR